MFEIESLVCENAPFQLFKGKYVTRYLLEDIIPIGMWWGRGAQILLNLSTVFPILRCK